MSSRPFSVRCFTNGSISKWRDHPVPSTETVCAATSITMLPVGSSSARDIRKFTSSCGSSIVKRPTFEQLLRKMSANEGAITAVIPMSSRPHTACSRDEPQPKFCWAIMMGAPAYAGLFVTKDGSFFQSKNANGP